MLALLPPAQSSLLMGRIVRAHTCSQAKHRCKIRPVGLFLYRLIGVGSAKPRVRNPLKHNVFPLNRPKSSLKSEKHNVKQCFMRAIFPYFSFRRPVPVVETSPAIRGNLSESTRHHKHRQIACGLTGERWRPKPAEDIGGPLQCCSRQLARMPVVGVA